MRVIRHSDADFATQLAQVTASSSLFDPVIEQRTRAILDAVAERGDAAVLELTEKFDGAKLSAVQLAVTREELLAASLKADQSLRAAVAEAETNIANFARKSRRKDWQAKNSHGATVGENSVVFYGADVGEGVWVAPNSVVMKNEVLPAGLSVAGCPVEPVERT